MAQDAKLNSGGIVVQIYELEVRLDSMEGNQEEVWHTTDVIKTPQRNWWRAKNNVNHARDTN